MFRIRKEIKLVLIVFTILFSIYLGVKRSNLDKIFIQADVEIDLSAANDIFENSFNNNKINFEYQVEDLIEINSLLSEINKTENTSTLYSEIKGNYNLTIFEVPVETSGELLSKLRNVDGISNENIQRAGLVLESTDLKENLNNNQIAKKRIQNLINDSVSPERITSFRKQLDVIQAKIDSLSIQKDIQKHNAEFDIIMLSAVKSINGNAALRSSMSVFILTTIATLTLLIIGLIISYYIFVLMYKLMLVLGIRTSRGSSSNYSYNYNRGYGRRTKRIYKDKDGNVIKKEEKE
ncbi:MAG: hypothetical protein PF570_07950 [Candidatus Cloacimonetes bacterium]|jgi:hypothetical protein|nr:hypothetical protein [Candidatus Cloacimonadota bacterium]